LLGIGWLIDLFLIPAMDREADLRFTAGPIEYNVAWILLTFLGALGVHRMYQGQMDQRTDLSAHGGLFFLGVLYDFWTLNDQVTRCVICVAQQNPSAEALSSKVSSRASSLPQGICVVHRSNVGASLLANQSQGHDDRVSSLVTDPPIHRDQCSEPHPATWQLCPMNGQFSPFDNQFSPATVDGGGSNSTTSAARAGGQFAGRQAQCFSRAGAQARQQVSADPAEPSSTSVIASGSNSSTLLMPGSVAPNGASFASRSCGW
jgi:hypothetical protein